MSKRNQRSLVGLAILAFAGCAAVAAAQISTPDVPAATNPPAAVDPAGTRDPAVIANIVASRYSVVDLFSRP